MARSAQREHFEMLVEYDPKYSVEQREDVDRKCVVGLVAAHPGTRVVRLGRRQISDYRAKLFATLEKK